MKAFLYILAFLMFISDSDEIIRIFRKKDLKKLEETSNQLDEFINNSPFNINLDKITSFIYIIIFSLFYTITLTFIYNQIILIISILFIVLNLIISFYTLSKKNKKEVIKDLILVRIFKIVQLGFIVYIVAKL